MPDVRVGAKTSEESFDARASGAFSSPVSPTALPRSTAGASSSRIGGSSSSPRCARRCMRRSVMPAARNARRFPGGGRVHPRSSKSNAISSRSLSDPFCRFSSAALGSVALGSRATAAAAPCDGRAEGARPAGTPRAARVSSTDDPTRGLELCVFSRDVFLRELENIRANNGNRPGDVMNTVPSAHRRSTHARAAICLARWRPAGRPHVWSRRVSCWRRASARRRYVSRASPAPSPAPRVSRFAPVVADRFAPRRPRARLPTAARRASTARSRPSAPNARLRCATTPRARRARSRWTTACCGASPAGVTRLCTAETRWRRGRLT